MRQKHLWAALHTASFSHSAINSSRRAWVSAICQESRGALVILAAAALLQLGRQPLQGFLLL
jgi:hypothetical protein